MLLSSNNSRKWWVFLVKRKTMKSSQSRVNQNNFFSFFFYRCSSTVVSIFPSPSYPTPLTPTSYPHLTTFWLFPCVLYTYSLMNLPLISPVIPLPPPLLFGLYFNVSSCILLAYLFCWLGSTYKWDHMVFVFPLLAYFT